MRVRSHSHLRFDDAKICAHMAKDTRYFRTWNTVSLLAWLIATVEERSEHEPDGPVEISGDHERVLSDHAMQAAWVLPEEVCRIRCCFCVSHIEREFLFELKIVLQQGDADGAFDVVRVECEER